MNKGQTLDLSFQSFSETFLFASIIWPLVIAVDGTAFNHLTLTFEVFSDSFFGFRHLATGAQRYFFLTNAKRLTLTFKTFPETFLFASAVWRFAIGVLLRSEEYVAESMICSDYGQTATLVKRVFHENLLHANGRALASQHSGKSIVCRQRRRTAKLDKQKGMKNAQAAAKN